MTKQLTFENFHQFGAEEAGAAGTEKFSKVGSPLNLHIEFLNS